MKRIKKTDLSKENSNYQDSFDWGCFNSRWQELLKESGMTQKALAAELDIQANQLNRWKNCKVETTPHYKHIKKLSEIFNVDMEYLYNPEYSHRNYGKEIEEHFEEIEEHFRSKHKAVIDYLESLGYEVQTNGNGRLFIHGVKEEPIPLDESLIERINHIVIYTLLS